MNCHQFELELGDYVDGTLPPARVSAVEAHVDSCTRCRATVADFTAIRGAARTLEPQMPAAHVWTQIAAAVEPEQRRASVETERSSWWRLGTGALAWKPLVAAAVMLVLLSGGTWLAWRDAARTRVTIIGSNGSPGGAVLDPEVQLAEQHYSSAIGDLEKVTQTESGSLDPETAKVVQANLEVIDQAIGQSRAALKSEPANPVAQDSLFDALRSKVQLLQDTVALINEMRKGNQEGAARIMSGMK
jgi:anti-sigma factor RsiW